MDKITVYVDVLFTTNFTINYLIMFAVIKSMGIEVKQMRIILASSIGAIYSVFIFQENLSFLYSNFAKFIVSCILVMVTLGLKNKSKFLKALIYFYIVSFAFAGATSFFNNYLGVLKVKNSVVYFDTSIWILLLGCIVGYFLITFFIKLTTTHYKKEKVIKNVVVNIEGKTICLKGLIDTGSSLIDPITRYPVVIVEYDLLKEILPIDVAEFLKDSSDINCNINRRYLDKIRLIPYKSLGATSILKGIRPDYIKFEDELQQKIQNVVVAVCYKSLSQSGEFNAILNPQIC